MNVHFAIKISFLLLILFATFAYICFILFYYAKNHKIALHDSKKFLLSQGYEINKIEECNDFRRITKNVAGVQKLYIFSLNKDKKNFSCDVILGDKDTGFYKPTFKVENMVEISFFPSEE